MVFWTSLLYGYGFSVKSIDPLKFVYNSLVSGVKLSGKVTELPNSEIRLRVQFCLTCVSCRQWWKQLFFTCFFFKNVNLNRLLYAGDIVLVPKSKSHKDK